MLPAGSRSVYRGCGGSIAGNAYSSTLPSPSYASTLLSLHITQLPSGKDSTSSSVTEGRGRVRAKRRRGGFERRQKWS
eukprot:14681-Pelagococcus_subviridis.AAC.4